MKLQPEELRSNV